MVGEGRLPARGPVPRFLTSRQRQPVLRMVENRAAVFRARLRARLHIRVLGVLGDCQQLALEVFFFENAAPPDVDQRHLLKFRPILALGPLAFGDPDFDRPHHTLPPPRLVLERARPLRRLLILEGVVFDHGFDEAVDGGHPHGAEGAHHQLRGLERRPVLETVARRPDGLLHDSDVIDGDHHGVGILLLVPRVRRKRVLAVQHLHAVPNDGAVVGVGVRSDDGRKPKERVPVLHVTRHFH
mmetsp:Transcript_38863/g.86863  ORF Transcript_38863/g.86863 Transcript_38863/m.86863 type:complete len:241 (-) Transcript_38863:53-775(-)